MGQRGRPRKIQLPGGDPKKTKMAQASLDNLKLAKKFTPGPNGTAAAASKLAAQARVAANKQRKTMAQLADTVAKARIKDQKVADAVRKIGIEDEDLTNSAVVVAGLFESAASGNIGAIEKWQELIGQGAEQNGDGASDGRPFLIPAILLARSFVDLNRSVEVNREYIVEGGRGSTKSSWISLKIIELMRNNHDLHACVIRKVKGTLRDSVYEQLKWAISELGFDDEYKCTVSPMQIENKKTGQRIYFRGLDDPTKIKSIRPPMGYIGILWVEEADQLNGPEELRNVGQSILRGGDGITFLSYNPPKSRMSWINKYAQEKVQKEDSKTTLHHSTYLDVPPAWLGTAFLEAAEHTKAVNEAAYQHEYLGLAIGDGAQVFDNLEIREITDDEVAAFDHIYQGNDWGYDPDPLAFVRLHYDSTRETVYLIDEYITKKTSNSAAAEEIKKRGYTDTYITCDSAEKKSTADFRAAGLPARNAVKGPDSVRYGMKWLTSKKIVIDPRRTPYAYKEFTHYEHDRDKDGNILSGYPDKDNHTIDAVRYALECVWRKQYYSA